MATEYDLGNVVGPQGPKGQPALKDRKVILAQLEQKEHPEYLCDYLAYGRHQKHM